MCSLIHVQMADGWTNMYREHFLISTFNFSIHITSQHFIYITTVELLLICHLRQKWPGTIDIDIAILQPLLELYPRFLPSGKSWFCFAIALYMKFGRPPAFLFSSYSLGTSGFVHLKFSRRRFFSFCPIFHFILSHDASDCCSLPSFHFAVILLMSFCLFGLISVSCSCLSVCCCCCYVFCVLLLCLCDLFIAIRICKLHLRSPFPWHLFHFSYVLPETRARSDRPWGKGRIDVAWPVDAWLVSNLNKIQI